MGTRSKLQILGEWGDSLQLRVRHCGLSAPGSGLSLIVFFNYIINPRLNIFCCGINSIELKPVQTTNYA